jgi:hypothetical protein
MNARNKELAMSETWNVFSQSELRRRGGGKPKQGQYLKVVEAGGIKKKREEKI